MSRDQGVDSPLLDCNHNADEDMRLCTGSLSKENADCITQSIVESRVGSVVDHSLAGRHPVLEALQNNIRRLKVVEDAHQIREHDGLVCYYTSCEQAVKVIVYRVVGATVYGQVVEPLLEASEHRAEALDEKWVDLASAADALEDGEQDDGVRCVGQAFYTLLNEAVVDVLHLLFQDMIAKTVEHGIEDRD